MYAGNKLIFTEKLYSVDQEDGFYFPVYLYVKKTVLYLIGWVSVKHLLNTNNGGQNEWVSFAYFFTFAFLVPAPICNGFNQTARSLRL